MVLFCNMPPDGNMLQARNTGSLPIELPQPHFSQFTGFNDLI